MPVNPTRSHNRRFYFLCFSFLPLSFSDLIVKVELRDVFVWEKKSSKQWSEWTVSEGLTPRLQDKRIPAGTPTNPPTPRPLPDLYVDDQLANILGYLHFVHSPMYCRSLRLHCGKMKHIKNHWIKEKDIPKNSYTHRSVCVPPLWMLSSLGSTDAERPQWQNKERNHSYHWAVEKKDREKKNKTLGVLSSM